MGTWTLGLARYSMSTMVARAKEYIANGDGDHLAYTVERFEVNYNICIKAMEHLNYSEEAIKGVQGLKEQLTTEELVVLALNGVLID